MTKERIIYADVLRIIATFAMIVLHVSSNRWYLSWNGFEWNVLTLYDSCVRWCVPVFFMISGMTFLNPSVDITYQKLFTKYIPRIIVALFFWGITYNLYKDIDKLNIHYIHTTLFILFNILAKNILGPPWYHLWFLYAIVGLYLITPMIRIFIKQATEKDIRYVLILFFIFGSLTNLLNYFLPYKISFVVPEFHNYIGYFIAGYYFSTYDVNKNIRVIFYLLAICSVALTFYATYVMSHKLGKPESFFYDNILPTTMIIAYAVFLFVKNCKFNAANIRASFLKNNYIIHLSNYCFGIYLIHDFGIKLLVYLNINSDTINPIVSVPLNSILVFIAALGIVYCIKKIPVLKDWIV